MYGFATELNYEQISRESSLYFNDTDVTTSSSTIADWYSYCREICTLALDEKYANSPPIGGPGHTVEIDEMKLGRRKYERGRVVEGSWILGLIDVETNELRLEICPDNKRDADTLLTLIR